jgi:hypothetical protein
MLRKKSSKILTLNRNFCGTKIIAMQKLSDVLTDESKKDRDLVRPKVYKKFLNTNDRAGWVGTVKKILRKNDQSVDPKKT